MVFIVELSSVEMKFYESKFLIVTLYERAYAIHFEILFSCTSNIIYIARESLRRLTRFLNSKEFFSFNVVEYYSFFNQDLTCFSERRLVLSTVFMTLSLSLLFYKNFNFPLMTPPSLFFFFKQKT